MKERKPQPKLFKLYLSYAIERNTLLILIFSIILLTIILFLVSNPWLDKGIYLEGYKMIHVSYFNQAIFIISIFNSLIIALISISLGINSISFDALFISYVKRRSICIKKLMAGFVIILILGLFEGLILNTIPLLMYDKFLPGRNELILVGFLISLMLLELVSSLALVTIIKSPIIALLVAFISIILKIITNGFSKIDELVRNVVPLLRVNELGYSMSAVRLLPIWIVVMLLFYIGSYEIKDLKQNL